MEMPGADRLATLESLKYQSFKLIIKSQLESAIEQIGMLSYSLELSSILLVW